MGYPLFLAASRSERNAPVRSLLDEIHAFAGKEIRIVFDFADGVLDRAVVAERIAEKSGQVQHSNTLAAVAAGTASHSATIIQPLNLLCKGASPVRVDETELVFMFL
jgi:hypothetical protein